MRKTMNNISKLAIVVLLSFSIPSLGAEKIPFQPDDIFRLKSASNPQISPDGKQIVYGIRGVDFANDVPSMETWVMKSDGSEKRLLFAKGGGAVWSPDSSRITYVAPDDSGTAQIHILDMARSAAPIAISSLQQSPSALTWSPDGKSIAFLSFVPTDSPWSVEIPVGESKPPAANWSEEPLVFNKLTIKGNGVGYLPYGNDHVFIISVEDGEARQVTKGDWTVGVLAYGGGWNALSWHPDGKRLFFPANMAENADMIYGGYIHEVDVETGKIKRISQEEGNWQAPKVSPDGRYLAYIGFDSAPRPIYQMQELWVSKVDGSDRQRVSGDLDETVYAYHWAADSETLYFNVAKHGERQLYRTTVDGEPGRLTDGAHMLKPNSMSNDGLIAGMRLSGREPAEVFVTRADSADDYQILTKLNEWLYQERKRGEFKLIDFESRDGTAIQQWLQLPPDFDKKKKYPLIVWIHGGPYSAYGQYYQETVDYLAAKDYVVALINYRSTVGYGTDFANGVEGGFPGQEDFDDIMGGVDAALAEGYIDEGRLFVAGCSAGGIETAWVVGHTDRFNAAVTMCPSVNNISSAGTSDYPIWSHRHKEVPFWEDPGSWLEHSPIMYVGNVKTPTAVFVGEHDSMTPVGQSEEFYTALKIAGVPTKLVIFRDEAHWFYRPVNKIRMIEYMLDWFRGYDPAFQ